MSKEPVDKLYEGGDKVVLAVLNLGDPRLLLPVPLFVVLLMVPPFAACPLSLSLLLLSQLKEGAN